MGNQTTCSIMAAEAFCKAVDERCLPGIDLSKALGGLTNVSAQLGAVQQAPTASQADLPQRSDSNTGRIV